MGPARADWMLSSVRGVGSAALGVMGTLAVSEVEPAGYALPASFVPSPWGQGAQEAGSTWEALYGTTLPGLASDLGSAE